MCVVGFHNDASDRLQMQLFLIRHAESENNARPLHQRVEDPGITAVGRMQAEHLAQWTRTMKIDTLITSPFLRTLQTTRSIVDATPQHVHVWHNVFERGGCYRGFGPEARQGGPGLGKSSILRHATGSPDQCVIDKSIGEEGWWGSRPREEDHEVEARARIVAKRLTDTFGATRKVVVAVIHAEFKRWLMAELFQGFIDAHQLGAIRNTGITKVDFDGEKWQLDWFNSVTHLPSRLITGHE
jgi:2,3-bisphosphoglycerate-dependent phosphoglycerate mutase